MKVGLAKTVDANMRRCCSVLTAVHHLHRFGSGIALYGLSQAPKDHPELASVGWLTFFQSLRRATLALLDDDLKRLTLCCEPLLSDFVLGW